MPVRVLIEAFHWHYVHFECLLVLESQYSQKPYAIQIQATAYFSLWLPKTDKMFGRVKWNEKLQILVLQILVLSNSMLLTCAKIRRNRHVNDATSWFWWWCGCGGSQSTTNVICAANLKFANLFQISKKQKRESTKGVLYQRRQYLSN